MLIMYGYRHLTKKRQKDEELMFDDVDERRKRKTKTKDENERRKASIEKEQKKVNIFKTNVLVPKKSV